MHHVFEADQLTWLIVGENFVISCCYWIIGSVIAYGVWRNRVAGVDSLVVTVAIIFFSCAFGHGLHGLKMLGLIHSLLWQTVADFLTVVIALRFLSFYKSFDLLACFSQIFASKMELENKNQLLEKAMTELKQTHTQLVQQEKMSSLGQLVAGVAHEINNPVNFIYGNLAHVQEYAESLLSIVKAYQAKFPPPSQIQRLTEEVDLEFLQEDLPKILASMKVGSDRIRQIVLSLRNFSRLDEAELKTVNIHEGIDNTLMILQHRLKAKPECPEITVVKDYSNLPDVECYPGSLNQVVMNILTNAIDALEESTTQKSYQEIKDHPAQITIRTSLTAEQWVEITIQDNGIGIPEHLQQQIFEPFFTTKPIGKGTGIGMSISHQIIAERHHGKLACFSTLGKGTEFVIQIPLTQGKYGTAKQSNYVCLTHK
ncbi:MAG: HAMP domain-containing histidine kinase [Mojavia pulchra JT2-VF2]|jgi:signal transduction histidine kinase|uniref:histidine kinase n=1 Tax=Mojavia pulchra JT2-VF2 TaxID=287848 RepID=A0A951UH13_9NOST|nr:HAMP domain-containing histidine kinase [Mojavia pulchra JT2-VF2]